MKKVIFQKINEASTANTKMLAVLLDPDNCKDSHLSKVIESFEKLRPDFIFVGGSHSTSSTEILIEALKNKLDIDIVLFPGDASQFSDKADALLFLSLLSGRNADFLIGQHVGSAINIKQSNIEVIPTAYILIEGGKTSSVEYISNTRPIPADKYDIAVSTAVAGELLGLKICYLEAGSGASKAVSTEMIKAIKRNTTTPLIVGGGIKTLEALKSAYDAGADLVVVGNIFEKEPMKIEQFIEFTQHYNKNRQ